MFTHVALVGFGEGFFGLLIQARVARKRRAACAAQSGASCPSQLRIFLRIPTRLLNRVFFRIRRDFLRGRIRQIEAGTLGNQKQIEQHVGALFGEPGLRRRLKRLGLEIRFTLPLRQLQQLRRLEIERHNEVLQSMKLAPVPRVPERDQASSTLR